MSSDRSPLPRLGERHRRTAVTTAAFALVACGVLTACDGSSGGSTPTGGTSPTAGSTAAGPSQSTSGGGSTTAGSAGSTTPTTPLASQTPSAKSSSARPTKSSYRPSSSAPAPSVTGTWGDSYHPLPSAATVPSKAKLKFVSIDYSALDGGWNLTAVVTYPGAQRSPLLYFALRSGADPAGPAAPFQLKAKQTVHVFITGDRRPTPTDVVVYAATSKNAQGRKLLTVAVPGSAISG